LMEVI